MSSTTQPNTSLYVKNLNTKTKKPELRRQLYVLFNSYGKVIDVVATRADGMRGQAFVVFRHLQSATAAMRALDGFEFYDKPLSITYSRTKSRANLIEEHGPEALYDPTLFAASKGAAPAAAGKVTFSSAQATAREKRQKRARGEEEEGAEEEEEQDEAPSAKIARLDEDKDEDDDEMEMDDSDDEANGASGSATGPPSAVIGTVPNELLLCVDLPAEVSEEALDALFKQFKGYESVQLVDAAGGRPAHAFVEFEDAKAAGVALEGLRDFQLAPGVLLTLGWAKRG